MFYNDLVLYPFFPDLFSNCLDITERDMFTDRFVMVYSMTCMWTKSAWGFSSILGSRTGVSFGILFCLQVVWHAPRMD